MHFDQDTESNLIPHDVLTRTYKSVWSHWYYYQLEIILRLVWILKAWNEPILLPWPCPNRITLLGTTSKPNRQLTDSSVQFWPVSIVINDATAPNPTEPPVNRQLCFEVTPYPNLRLGYNILKSTYSMWRYCHKSSTAEGVIIPSRLTVLKFPLPHAIFTPFEVDLTRMLPKGIAIFKWRWSTC